MIRLTSLVAISLLVPLSAAAETRVTLLAGSYECKVSKDYAFRACSVEVRDGLSYLKMPGDVGFLVGLEGFLYPTEDKGTVYFETTLRTDSRPWGCFNCAERCTTDPASCECKEIPVEATKECLASQVQVLLKGKGGTWTGMLPYKIFGWRYEDRRPVGTEFTVWPLKVVIRKKGGAGASGGKATHGR